MKLRFSSFRHAGPSVLFTLLLGAGCAVQPEVGAEREAVGSAQEPDVVTGVPAGDPRVDPECTNVGDYTLNNAGYPRRERGACPSPDEYTFDQAAAACDADVKYYTYTCTEFGDGTHAWTSYFGCCAASCDDGIQNGGETGVDCGGPCGPCPSPVLEALVLTSNGGGVFSNSDNTSGTCGLFRAFVIAGADPTGTILNPIGNWSNDLEQTLGSGQSTYTMLGTGDFSSDWSMQIYFAGLSSPLVLSSTSPNGTINVGGVDVAASASVYSSSLDRVSACFATPDGLDDSVGSVVLTVP